MIQISPIFAHQWLFYGTCLIGNLILELILELLNLCFWIVTWIFVFIVAIAKAFESFLFEYIIEGLTSNFFME